MREIIHWYNINRKRIWRIIGVIVIVILLVKMLETIWIGNQEEERKFIKEESDVGETLNSITLEDKQSVISGQTITQSQNNALETLDEFINYCNNGNVNEAYNLLSEDCKKEMYSTIDKFKESYYGKIFGELQKNVSVENWINNIYKVEFIDDALSTGIYSTENSIQDYITIERDENDNFKLNINNYIGKQLINEEQEYKNINIKVLEKHKYMDFETYVFEVTNNSEYTILLNDNNNLDTMYLEDKNNIKYTAYIHELSEAELTLISGETKRITIKYYNKYSSNKQIKNIVFSKIILNNTAYINQTVGSYRDFGTIKIKL